MNDCKYVRVSSRNLRARARVHLCDTSCVCVCVCVCVCTSLQHLALLFLILSGCIDSIVQVRGVVSDSKHEHVCISLRYYAYKRKNHAIFNATYSRTPTHIHVIHTKPYIELVYLPLLPLTASCDNSPAFPIPIMVHMCTHTHTHQHTRVGKTLCLPITQYTHHTHDTW